LDLLFPIASLEYENKTLGFITFCPVLEKFFVSAFAIPKPLRTQEQFPKNKSIWQTRKTSKNKAIFYPKTIPKTLTLI